MALALSKQDNIKQKPFNLVINLNRLNYNVSFLELKMLYMVGTCNSAIDIPPPIFCQLNG